MVCAEKVPPVEVSEAAPWEIVLTLFSTYSYTYTL